MGGGGDEGAGGVWARIGSLEILSKHRGNASQVSVVAKPGRWGCGHALAAFLNTL